MDAEVRLLEARVDALEAELNYSRKSFHRSLINPLLKRMTLRN